MNYIILDMEWDSAYYPPAKQFINQILQIGAVKLDEDFNIVDVFDKTIKSSFSRRVTKRFTELTGISKEDMLAGVELSDAVSEYNKWASGETITMTWSTSDLYTILQNEKCLLKNLKFRFDKYLDLQKYIEGELRLLGHECNSQISLLHAAELLNVTTEKFDLHTAKDDSLLSAALLKGHYSKERFMSLVRDTNNPEFYDRLCFKPYYISNIDDKRIDKSELSFICPQCKAALKQKGKWRFKNRNFTAELSCESCKKKYIGRASFRKCYDKIVIKKHLGELKPKKLEVKKDEMQSLSKKV